jgi:hypothetical protein
MPSATVNALFDKAGVSDSEQRVFKAVSLLEGGLDSVNTYDTGNVSVGFIQFAALDAGAGSLGQLLLRYKQQDPDGFRKFFRAYGVEVTAEGKLAALEARSGQTVTGPSAAKAIILDKRLIAAFQHAGQKSTAFQIAQLQTAKALYYPANDPVTATVAGRTYSGKVSDIFTTEAGLATLMDRKVNTGKLGNLNQLVSQKMAANRYDSVSDCRPFEFELIRSLKFRYDFLADLTLSQPRAAGSETSRGGRRN